SPESPPEISALPAVLTQPHGGLLPGRPKRPVAQSLAQTLALLRREATEALAQLLAALRRKLPIAAEHLAHPLPLGRRQLQELRVTFANQLPLLVTQRLPAAEALARPRSFRVRHLLPA